MASLTQVLSYPTRGRSLSAIGPVLERLRLRKRNAVARPGPSRQPGKIRPDTGAPDAAADAGPPPVWPEWRIELMERLWGEGFLLPGGEDFVTELAKPLNISEKASVLVVGSGMGGPARLIAETFKTFVDGIEQDRELAEASAERATVIGGLKRVKIGHMDYDGETSFGRRYDAIIGQEALLPLNHKQQLIVTCATALKTGGKLVLTDFALPDDAVIDDDFRLWLTREHTNAAPVSEAELRVLTKQNGMIVRVVEDMTNRYLKLALEGWTGFEKWFNENSHRRDILEPMLEEAERWSQRINLLKAGKLRYVRMLAIKSRPRL